jgi:hypothetical protein
MYLETKMDYNVIQDLKSGDPSRPRNSYIAVQISMDDNYK